MHTYMYRVLHCSVDSSIYSSHVNGICISTVKVSLLTIRKKVVTNSGMIIQLTGYWIIVIYDEIIFERDR